MEITCPSGLRGIVRKLKGSETNFLTDRKAAKRGELFDKILGACWIETIDPGPYVTEGVAKLEPGSARVDWDSILLGDRFYALVCIRAITHGSKYSFGYTCPACEEKGEWEIDLLADLPIYDLPDASRSTIARGLNEFETTVGGKPIKFRLMTGKMEKRAAKALRKNPEELITTALAQRICEVEGNAMESAIKQFIDNMEMSEQFDILDQMSEQDGGVEGTIEIECVDCEHVFEVQLPFEGREFWLPPKHSRTKSERRKKRNRKTRTIRGD